MKPNSGLEKLLAKKEFVIIAGIGIPRGADFKPLEEGYKLLDKKVDAFYIPDNPGANVQLLGLAAAAHIQKLGGEAVLELNCRDRNRIAIQSYILGAAALGIANLLCSAGDHQTLGSFRGAKRVYDIDLVQAIQVAKVMRDEKKFSNGEEIPQPPSILIGAEVNPFADPFDFRVTLMAKKVEAGADFVQTRGVFDLERFGQWMERVRQQELHQKTPILAGITPLVSVEQAKALQEARGMMVPDSIIKRLESSDKPEEEGIKIAGEIIAQVKKMEGVVGVVLHVGGMESLVPDLIKQGGLSKKA